METMSQAGSEGRCPEDAPVTPLLSAWQVGADLSHVFCTEGAATVIKSYSPELIVHPYLPDSNGADDKQVPLPTALDWNSPLQQSCPG